jgi:capsular exopolysaccharide synthesis family protein
MMKTRLAELELERAELLNRYKPDNYHVVRINDSIAQIKKILADEKEQFHGSIATGKNQNYQKAESDLLVLETDIASYQAKLEELDKQLLEYGAELERLGRLEPELRSLKRNVATNEQTYRLYLTKFEESRVSEAMDAAKMVSVSVIEPAQFPARPLPVNTLLNFFVSLCVGGLAGFGLAFLLEYFDHTLKVPEDVGKMLDLPFIGAIEDLTEKGLPDLKTLAASPSSPPPFEILKGNLKTLASETRTRIFSVCASSDDEGASTIAFNLAASLTKDKGQRVLLVDGNVREPALHSLFNLPMAPGLSDLVLDGADIRQTPRETAIPNLFVLTCGTIPANPIGLFESPRLSEFVATVRADFNWIIVDGAPVNAYPDTAALASKVDATILVVQAETKRAEVALQAKERLEKGGGSILGVVLNRRRFIIPEAIYRRL